MRSSISLQSWVCGLVAAAMFALALGVPAVASDGFSVADLAEVTDLEPLAAIEQVSIDLPEAKVSAATARSLARQSVPARDRSGSYRDGELFRNSKVALPLLVSDLEPKAAVGIRPLSGRSVGARPAAAWTRATTHASALDLEGDSPRRASATWSSVGQR